MRISESRYSNPERLPERAETDSFNMHRDQWTGVSPEGQKIWDQLSEEDKAVILKKTPTSNSSKPSRSTIHQKPNSRKVNIHETSVYDVIMANAHQLEYGEQDTEAVDDAAVLEDTRPQMMRPRHCMHFSLVAEMMPRQPTSTTYCPLVQSVLRTSHVKPTRTLPIVLANTKLTNPVPSSIMAQTVV